MTCAVALFRVHRSCFDHGSLELDGGGAEISLVLNAKLNARAFAPFPSCTNRCQGQLR